MNWISVDKKMPPLDKPLILTDGESIKEGSLVKQDKCRQVWRKNPFDLCNCCYDLSEVTHWALRDDFLPKDNS